MNSYQPGDSVRMSVTITVLGVATNPTSIQLQLQPPSGGTQVVFSSPTNDSPGAYHQDYTLPGPTPGPAAAPGIWKYRWTSSGGPVTQNGVSEGQFIVQPLSF